MSFKIVQNDITKMVVDAIVNAANTKLKKGGGVCGAIFQAAGPKKLQEACDELTPIKVGEAVITPGFNLKAKYIIHTVGPIYQHYSPEESRHHLEAAYLNSLELAVNNNCQSIAFPLISSGIYGYPKDEALEIAISTIQSFVENNEIEVFLVLFDR